MRGACCARSLACEMKKAHEHSHHGHTGIIRHSLRNGFNGFLRALPGDRACLTPSLAKVVFRKLETSGGASGPHDFSVRIRRASSLRAVNVHRIPSHVRDDRETPLMWDGTKSVYFCFYPTSSRISEIPKFMCGSAFRPSCQATRHCRDANHIVRGLDR